MENVPNLPPVFKSKELPPYSRYMSTFILHLWLGLVACSSGATSQDQAAEPPAPSQSESAVQDEPAPQLETVDETASQDKVPGSEEFGLTMEELVASVETVETAIGACMREAGFEYFPVDFLTVREAMGADQAAVGISDEEWASEFGYGISTQPPSADTPPQHAGPDTVVQIGLGEQNIQIFESLSEADQAAYNHALFGENTDATFAITLEQEDFSETEGCTRTAIEQAFDPEELSAAYYNPLDTLISEDPRMIDAIGQWSECMREAGFDYNNPDEPELDLEARLEALLDGVEPEALSGDGQAALIELQGEERAIAVAHITCEEEIIEPVEDQIHIELYGSP